MPTRIPPAVKPVPAVRRSVPRRAMARLVPAPAAGQAHSAGPDPAQVARLAYSYWEARSRQGGSPEEDWLRAEDELRGRSVQG
jgi:Protein of unknown function (DUF2934)